MGNNDQTAVLLLSAASKAGRSLARKRNGNNGWVILQKEHAFNTVSGTADYAMPADFDRLIQDTLWDRTNFWEMRGPLTPAQWQVYKSSILGNSITLRQRYRIRNSSNVKVFSIDPTPTSGDNLVFEYVSKNWCQNSSGTGQADWAADNDTGLIDEYLIELDAEWRVLKRMGMAYEEEMDEAEREIAQALASDGGSTKLTLDKDTGVQLIGMGNVPDTSYGS